MQIKALFAIGFLFTSILAQIHAADFNLVRDGDIIFQDYVNSRSAAISQATNSPYTHVGIIFYRGKAPYVYEAVQPVSYMPLEAWIKRGGKEMFVVKRLKDSSKLNELNVQKLHAEVDRFLGKDYDAEFRWSDDQIYCSELVWKAYDRAMQIQLGSPKKLSEYNLSGSAVRKHLIITYGSRTPMDETMIAPSDIFACKSLIEVIRN